MGDEGRGGRENIANETEEMEERETQEDINKTPLKRQRNGCDYQINGYKMEVNLVKAKIATDIKG